MLPHRDTISTSVIVTVNGVPPSMATSVCSGAAKVLFDVSIIKNELVSKTLSEVFEALSERGYNPVNQMVGYLISGDPGYISSYKNARTKIGEIDRAEIIQTILEFYLENKK